MNNSGFGSQDTDPEMNKQLYKIPEDQIPVIDDSNTEEEPKKYKIRPIVR
jgi:hypothetical protein